MFVTVRRQLMFFRDFSNQRGNEDRQITYFHQLKKIRAQVKDFQHEVDTAIADGEDEEAMATAREKDKAAGRD